MGNGKIFVVIVLEIQEMTHGKTIYWQTELHGHVNKKIKINLIPERRKEFSYFIISTLRISYHKGIMQRSNSARRKLCAK